MFAEVWTEEDLELALEAFAPEQREVVRQEFVEFVQAMSIDL